MYTAGKRAGRQTVAAQLSDFTCKWKPHTPPGFGFWDRENKKGGTQGTLMT